MVEVQIDDSIFRDFPSFRRGLVLAEGLENKGNSRDLEDKLNDALAQAAIKPVDLKTDLRVLAWSDAHRRFGSNPNKFPPAHAALLKRIQKRGARLPFVNKVVAVMKNIAGLKQGSRFYLRPGLLGALTVKWIEKGIGLDRLLIIHKRSGLIVLCLVLGHPVLMTLGERLQAFQSGRGTQGKFLGLHRFFLRENMATSGPGSS